MKGPKIFTFAVENIPNIIKETLEKNKLSLDDIDLFVFHQASSYMLNYLRELCNIPEEKFFVEIETIGNTVSASIPIALKLASEKTVSSATTARSFPVWKLATTVFWAQVLS